MLERSFCNKQPDYKASHLVEENCSAYNYICLHTFWDFFCVSTLYNNFIFLPEILHIYCSQSERYVKIFMLHLVFIDVAKKEVFFNILYKFQ
jgi:hypothetical protein